MDDFEKLINASDLIEWIMETYPDWCVGDVRSIVDHVKDLPAAQPEVIRCKDCRYYDAHECKHPRALIFSEDDDFCSHAERRIND